MYIMECKGVFVAIHIYQFLQKAISFIKRTPCWGLTGCNRKARFYTIPPAVLFKGQKNAPPPPTPNVLQIEPIIESSLNYSTGF